MKFCAQCGQSLEPSKRTSVAPLSLLKAPFLKQAFLVTAGAILMFISLGVPWYSWRWGTISSGDLLSRSGEIDEVVWAGWGLPVMLVICIATLVLLSVAVSLWTGTPTRRFWSWMGILAIICVVANASYVGWWTNDNELLSGGLVHAGFVLALSGGVTVLFGGAVSRT